AQGDVVVHFIEHALPFVDQEVVFERLQAGVRRMQRTQRGAHRMLVIDEGVVEIDQDSADAHAATGSASREARLRSCSFRKRLRSRIVFGVTSTSSSSAMNSTALSSVSWIGGTRRTASSVPDARTLVNCLPLIGLTTRSLSREWMPMTMPSYSASPGETNMRPRSCSFHSA